MDGSLNVYRLYTDAFYNMGVSAVLQQIQSIRVGDLKGTKTFKRFAAHFRPTLRRRACTCPLERRKQFQR